VVDPGYSDARTPFLASKAEAARSTMLALLLALLLTSCVLERQPGVIIRSDLADPVEIVYLKDGEMQGGRLEPGASMAFPFDLVHWGASEKESCTTADIVARSLDGTVIARIPPPQCIGQGLRLSDWLVP
jgi:hypothetical protein